jgi:hypothetical protein
MLLGNMCNQDMGQQIMAILEVQNASFEEKYLGLLEPDGRMKERYKKKMSDWSGKYLAGAAKEVLIKSVIQAIQTYTMSVFKFSSGLCEDLMQMIRNFWWDDDVERRHIHWTSLENITKRKSQGGMGWDSEI